MKTIAAIDQGTTGTTVLLLDPQHRVVGRGYEEIPQHYPAPGWVEHDPEDYWRSTLRALAQARAAAGEPTIVAVGITNQRETTVLWDKDTGAPVAPAIVWQDRRTQDLCATLKQAGHEAEVQRKSGLLIDPYFSATKIAWLLDNVPGLRARAEAGHIAFGTVDAYLAHRLSGGKAHVMDVTNASRTLLLSLETLRFDPELCRLFGVPEALLPTLVPSCGQLATLKGVPGIADGTWLAGIAGDQQAALYGQDCLQEGQTKCTYGTGAFILMNTGARPVASRHRLLSSVAWQIDGATTYALEGSAFIAGALVQWLRDGLGIIEKSADVEPLARSVKDSGGITIVPALAGLGAPHWRPEARGLISGITRGTTRAHLARAALEAIALEVAELAQALEADSGRTIPALRVDGGATANDLLLQIQADLLGVDVLRPGFIELTALGAAKLAGHATGFFATRAPPTPDTRFSPTLSSEERQAAFSRWQRAVEKA